MSPAAFASAKARERAKGRETPHSEAQTPAWNGRCMWCDSELGTHDHIMWECPHIQEGAPRKPSQPMTARLGWPTKKGIGEETAVQAATRISWMRYVCKVTWWQRYKPEKKRPAAWGDPTRVKDEAEGTSDEEEDERNKDNEDEDSESGSDSDSNSAESDMSDD